MENPFKKKVDESVEGINEETISEENNEVETETENIVEETTETVEQVEETPQSELEVLQAKYDILNNQYIRLAADFDNFRKRQAQERESLLKYGAENTIKNLLDVLDNFERGLKAIETVDDCEKLKECYTLAYKNFSETLTKLGLEEINAGGQEFDPNLHEAVMQTPTDSSPENTVLVELQKGYKLGDKVLRPSLVNVATAVN